MSASLKQGAFQRMLKGISQDLQRRPGRQAVITTVHKIALSSLEPHFMKALGGREAAKQVASEVIDHMLDEGLVEEREHARQFVLRLV
jgi:hypothetical protein